MKLIYPGIKKWWVGKQAFCGYCCAMIVIEEGDNLFETPEPEVLAGKCPSCGLMFKIFKAAKDYTEQLC